LPADPEVCITGIIFCEILSRQFADSDTFKREMPSFGIDPAEVHSRASLDCPPAFIDLAIACCEDIPTRRPTVRQVLERLQVIEKQVLAADQKSIKDPLARAYNIGSMNFSGMRTKKQLSRPSMPGRIPSFEGQVKVPSNPSSSASDTEDEAVEDILKSLEDVRVDGGKAEESQSYSTLVIGRGNKAATSSIMTVKACTDDSQDQSFPSLPSSWLIGAPPEVVAQIKGEPAPKAATAKDQEEPSSSEEEDPFPVTPDEMSNLPSEIKGSFISGRPSTAAATVNGGADEEEERDYFFSAPSTFDPALHRFSLAKPGWRLFSTKSTVAATSELKASQSMTALDSKSSPLPRLAN
jgi:LIM domain kinase 1